jgi:hypothetical protein
LDTLVVFDATSTLRKIEIPNQQPFIARGCLLNGLSGNGAIIVGMCSVHLAQEDGEFPFLFRANVGPSYLDLSSVDPESIGQGYISDVSDDGNVVVGGWLSPYTYEHVAYVAEGTKIDLLDPYDAFQQDESVALAVSGDGSVIVGEHISNYSYDESFWVLDRQSQRRLALSGGRPIGINGDGSVIVGSAIVSGNSHAVRWTGSAASFEDLGRGWLLATNGDGSVSIGGNETGIGLFTRAGFVSLSSAIGVSPDASGWTLDTVTSISSDGTVVVGTGHHDNVSEGFVLHLP